MISPSVARRGELSSSPCWEGAGVGGAMPQRSIVSHTDCVIALRRMERVTVCEENASCVGYRVLRTKTFTAIGRLAVVTGYLAERGEEGTLMFVVHRPVNRNSLEIAQRSDVSLAQLAIRNRLHDVRAIAADSEFRSHPNGSATAFPFRPSACFHHRLYRHLQDVSSGGFMNGTTTHRNL